MTDTVVAEADSSFPNHDDRSSFDSGHPVQIVTVDSRSGEFVLDEEALSSILLSSDCKDRPVSVVSITGDFRKGKSFLLNFILRYLTNKGYEGQDWLKDRNIPLKGFSWRGGSRKDTTGIIMWSKPFVIKTSASNEVAVLLMDTQGAFDLELTVKDCTTVLALSTMTSSVQVFNILRNLQEDNLQGLQLFSDYGRLAIEAGDQVPFQNFFFVIRDWPFAYDYEYGLEGGHSLLDEVLKTNDKEPLELQRTRKHIRSCFNDISCFLMPHPGKAVTEKNFDGRLTSINQEFLDRLQTLVPLLVSPEKLVVKKISGSEVTGRQLLEYFKVYINVFTGEAMPEPNSIFEATAEANNRAAVALARDFYQSKMEALVGGNTLYVDSKDLEKKHMELFTSSIELFHKPKKFGGLEYSEPYLKGLKNSIEETWTNFKARNQYKKTRLPYKQGAWNMV